MGTPPNARPKDYRGDLVVPHVIRPRETLSSIAKIYTFPTWQPIWVYNREIERTLEGDPDLIREGVTIFIPRKPQGYDTVIAKLERLRLELEGDRDRLRFEIERDENELEALKVAQNFAGDVATLLGALTARAVRVGLHAAAARSAVGQAKIAARLAARQEAHGLAKQYAAARSRLVKDALVKHGKLRQSRAALSGFPADKAKDALVKAADDQYQRRTGADGEPFKHAKNALAARKVIKKSAKEAFLASAEIVVDYMEVSKITEIVLGKWYGEDTKTTFSRAQAKLDAETSRMTRTLEEKIGRLGAERDLLYGRPNDPRRKIWERVTR